MNRTEMMDTLLWCVLRYYRNLLNYRIASADEGLDNEGYAILYIIMHIQGFIGEEGRG